MGSRSAMRASTVLMSALLLLATIAPIARAASGVTTAPVLASPASGATVNGNPTFAWGTVVGAATYRLQVAAASTFATLLLDVPTSNRYATPTTPLPVAALNWRVAGVDSGGVTGPWATGTFTEKWDPGVPTLVTPADGSRHQLGGTSPAFTWSWVAGAAKYQFAWSTAANFSGATITLVATNAFTLAPALNQPVPGTTYYWRVRAVRSDNVAYAWSAPRSLIFDPLPAPTLVGPSDGSSSFDPVLQWVAVAGSTGYEIQVQGPDSVSQQTVNTSIRPLTDVIPGTYTWKVRALNSGSNWQGAWSAARTIIVTDWPAGPALRAPSNGAVVGLATTFAWQPVPGAAGYYFDVIAAGSSFPSPNGAWTAQPSFVLGYDSNEQGFLRGAGQYQWRVRAVLNKGTNARQAYSSVGTFVYQPPAPPALISPAAGSTVSELSFHWTAMRGTPGSEVIVTIAASGTKLVDTLTDATTYNAPIYNSGGDVLLEWWVRNNDFESQHVQFTYHPAPLGGPTLQLVAPADGATGYVWPTLTWTPLAGAARHVVHLCRDDGTTCTFDPIGFEAGPTSFTEVGPAQPGSYHWYVEAQDDARNVLASTGQRSFTISNLPSPALLAPANCGPLDACFSADEPDLQWAAVPGAKVYKVTITRDPTFVMVPEIVVTVSGLHYRPPVLMEDSPGGAHTWYVQACSAVDTFPTDADCTLVATARASARTFVKHSPPVTLLGPPNGAAITAQDFTLTWQDYLLAEQAAGSGQEAENYEVQISSNADFVGNLTAGAFVSGTDYRVEAIPFGTLYWRVRALHHSVDSTGTQVNGTVEGPWSAVRSFAHQSAAPSPSSPAGGATVASDTPIFKWTPMAPGQSYRVEISRQQGSQWLETFSTPGVAFAVTTAGRALRPGTYRWRVQRFDVVPHSVSSYGPFSAYSTFTIAAADPASLLGGADPAYTDHQVLLRWQPVDRATAYRVELNTASDFSGSGQTVDTQALSWAPPGALADGRYYWRVTTLNAAGNVLSASAVGTFRYLSGTPPPPPPPTTIAADSFGRTLTDSWGTATTGGAWTLTGGAANFDIAGGVGTVALTAAAANRAAMLSAVSARDVDFSLRFATDKVVTGNSEFLYAVVRRVSSTREYRLKIRLAPGGGVFLQPTALVDGTETSLGAEVRVTGLVNAPNVWLRLRGRVTGASPTTIQMRAWADGQAEPSTWNVNLTDSTATLQLAGAVGLRSYLSGAVTNAPLVVSVDDLLVTDAGS